MSRCGDETEKSDAKPAVESPSPAPAIHLLDDDSDWLLFLFEFLSQAGFQVTAACRIDDALDLVARSRPEVLIADREIPGLTEIELLDRVRTLSPATRVILTAERSSNLSSLRWVRSTGADVLFKPIDWATLRRAVERATRDLRIGEETSRF